MKNHIHEYRRRRPASGVEVCYCGRFRWTEHAGPAIIEIPTQAALDAHNKRLK